MSTRAMKYWSDAAITRASGARRQIHNTVLAADSAEHLQLEPHVEPEQDLRIRAEHLHS